MTVTDKRMFVETWPLFAQTECDSDSPPDTISLACSKCGKETTWYAIAKNDSIWDLFRFSGYIATYQCLLCKTGFFSVLVRTATKPQKAGGTGLHVQKIGQFPPPLIAIPRDVEKRLGADDARLYKNALVCRSQGYGIGALAYMRRVVEDQTNELIEVIALQTASFGIAANEIEKIRSLKEAKVPYEERLRLAAEAIPSVLKPDGANPLAALYELLSRGLHAKSDDECLAIAEEIREVFEYLFSRLRAEIEDRDSVVAKIKKWVGTR